MKRQALTLQKQLQVTYTNKELGPKMCTVRSPEKCATGKSHKMSKILASNFRMPLHAKSSK